MSYELQVSTKKLSDQKYQTTWTTSSSKTGLIVSNIIDGNDGDTLISAELSVIYHLLIDRAIFGENITGKSLKLIVSLGAIKKLHKQKSAKTKLIKYASFLTSRFSDAVIDVSKKRINLTNKHIETSTICPGKTLNDQLIIKGLGKIIIKSHAIEAFYKRVGFQSRSNAWLKLTKLISNNRIDTNWKPAEHVISYHRQKYHKKIEYWFDRNTKWLFVIVNKNNLKILVTMYPYLVNKLK